MVTPTDRPDHTLPTPLRIVPLVLGILALLAGLWAGLWRLGWRLPVHNRSLPLAHGPLMVSGFLGTLISLERAVALKKNWTFTGPVCAGLGALSLVLGLQTMAGPLAILLGSGVLSVIFLMMFRREPELHYAVMGVGADLWLIGNLLWIRGFGIPQVVPWWMGFLVLTIAGERLELNRLFRLTGGIRAMFLTSTGGLVVSLFLSLWEFDIGMRLTGIALTGLALWLVRYDMARKSLRRQGLARFIAVAMLTGYFWLGMGGILALWQGGVTAGYFYDAILHAVFVGFVFSMIFGHAPVIFPAVLHLPLTFRRSSYIPLVLLHLSLLTRVAGDIMAVRPVRMWGGMFNAVAVLLFLYNTITAIADNTFASGQTT